MNWHTFYSEDLFIDFRLPTLCRQFSLLQISNNTKEEHILPIFLQRAYCNRNRLQISKSWQTSWLLIQTVKGLNYESQVTIYSYIHIQYNYSLETLNKIAQVNFRKEINKIILIIYVIFLIHEKSCCN